MIYTAGKNRRASFDITVAFETDLDRIIGLLQPAVASVDDVAPEPTPSVQASALDNNAITLTIEYWYPSSMASGSAATDGAIRAVRRALADEGVALAIPVVDIGRSPGTSQSEPDGTTWVGSSDGQPTS